MAFTNPVITRMMSPKGSEHLSSYLSACREDPDLKSFDSSLDQLIKKMMSSLATQTKTQYLPLDSLMEVYEVLFELSQNMVKIIDKFKEDVCKNKELSSLVDLYLKSTMETLNLFNTVDKFVQRAKISQLIIRFAVKQFEAESKGTDLGGSKKKKYAKTLGELNKFKAKGDPLGEEFVAHYKYVFELQVKLLEDLCEQKVLNKLDKKLKKVKKLEYFSNAFFGTAVASVLVASVLSLAIISAHSAPVAAPLGLAAAHLAPGADQHTVDVWRWVSDMFNTWEKDVVEKHKDSISLMKKSTIINKGAMEAICTQVENLRGRRSMILKAVDFALEKEEEEEATRLAMQEITKNVEEFTKKIEQVGENADKFTKSIVSGRFRVLEHIANSTGEW